tara:strand:- start:517 stop:1236 length:720 start_codon:yes stop_codon:yes gene_type:complete
MGIFGKKFEISESQIKKLNDLLPSRLQKDIFEKKDFEGTSSLIVLHRKYREYVAKEIDEIKNDIEEIKSNSLKEKSSKIKIFNCHLDDVKPLGMVDVGAIHQFSGASTGERFAGGLIGYALEMAIDDVWKKSTKQEDSVNETKLKLLMKAMSIYPKCNVITNFDIDFREMGSSGNVFIYMRGTACEGKNDMVNKIQIDINKKISSRENEIKKKEKSLEEAMKNADKIPQSVTEINEKLK